MADSQEDMNDAWHICRSGWCAGRFDHASCSLINAHIPNLFNDRWGLIFSSQTKVECFYTGDGGTWSRYMGGCYDFPLCYEGKTWECQWSFQTQLAQGIRNHMSTSPGGYNEFIISVKMHACAER